MLPMSTNSRATPIGTVSVTEQGGSIISLRIGGSDKRDGSDVTDEAFTQLFEYLEGGRKEFNLELGPNGTPFQKDVWNALMKIPYGKTVSYSEIAKASGHPKALRAVGTAIGKNPIPVIIPCHRVIRSDGSIGGYALGIDLKIRLLRLEGTL